MWLLAELTYSCPLQCGYCSNPIDYRRHQSNQLSTDTWKRVFREGRELGAVHLGFSGGEPCVRQDLEELIAYARELGYFTNLITSTVGLTEDRIERLRAAGVDHIQVSFQGVTGEINDTIAGTRCFDHKMAMAKAVSRAGIPLVTNFVLHRHNLHQVGQILELSRSLGAEAVELANCQYHGWAMKNFQDLIPSIEQIQEAEQEVEAFRARYDREMDIFFVVPDVLEKKPRPCLNGWASTMITVTPDGRVLPCQGAQDFPGTRMPHVADQSLTDIWHAADLFRQYRGFDWMKEPCASCSKKDEDFGGCRCQAFQLTGDPGNTDPVCTKSPHHHRVEALLGRPSTGELVMRTPNQRRIPLTTLGEQP